MVPKVGDSAWNGNYAGSSPVTLTIYIAGTSQGTLSALITHPKGMVNSILTSATNLFRYIKKEIENF